MLAVKLNINLDLLIKMINLSVKSLEAFFALKECRQFTSAAKRCHVTQSAFSQIIARLEAQIGMRLFDRDTRSVRLTAEGELFALKAQEILSHIDRAVTDMQDYANKRWGRLALAIVPSLAGSWLPGLVRQYRQIYPGITLDLHDTSSERCLQLLRSSKVDIAVTAQPGNHGECLTDILSEEPFYLVCSERHAPKRKRPLTLRDLHGVPVIHLVHTEHVRAISSGDTHPLRPLLRDAGVQEVGIEVEHATTLAGLVAQGLGTSVVPHSMLDYFQLPSLLCLPISRTAMRRPIFIVRRQWDSLPPAAATFVEMMHAQPPGSS